MIKYSRRRDANATCDVTDEDEAGRQTDQRKEESFVERKQATQFRSPKPKSLFRVLSCDNLILVKVHSSGNPSGLARASPVLPL